MNNARFKPKTVPHSFVKGDVVMQVISKNQVEQYFVAEVLSPFKLRLIRYNGDGSLSSLPRIFENEDLMSLCKNEVSTRLLKEK